MAQYLHKSGLSLTLTALAIIGAALLLLSCTGTGADREVRYARAVDDILLCEYDEAAILLRDLGDYKDSPLLLAYLESRAAYAADGPDGAARHLRVLCDLGERYDGVLTPLFYSEISAMKK